LETDTCCDCISSRQLWELGRSNVTLSHSCPCAACECCTCPCAKDASYRSSQDPNHFVNFDGQHAPEGEPSATNDSDGDHAELDDGPQGESPITSAPLSQTGGPAQPSSTTLATEAVSTSNPSSTAVGSAVPGGDQPGEPPKDAKDYNKSDEDTRVVIDRPVVNIGTSSLPAG
jgi:hypothetical protein